MRVILAVCLMAGSLMAADYPQAEISNGKIHAKIYLPDAQNGFYRSTRFDWSGVISSLEFEGHNYYGPWFTKQDPTVRDFVYRDSDIVVSAESGSMGPADEFQTPVGFDTAAVGGTFIKIGVGILRKADAMPYSAYRKYEIVDPGKWTVNTGPDWAQFMQELKDPATGFAYVYRKTIRLSASTPEMTIWHSLRNTGSQPIRSNVYNHNFLVLDQTPPGPGYELTMHFPVTSSRPPNKDFAEIRGKQIVYLKTLQDRDTVAMPVEGFSPYPADYDIRVENKKLGAGMHIVGDHSLASMALWSIRSVLAIEPFIAVEPAPGTEMTWSYIYSYYTFPKAN